MGYSTGGVAHAASHSDGGSDEVTAENLATSGAVDSIPISDGAGAVVMSSPFDLLEILTKSHQWGEINNANFTSVVTGTGVIAVDLRRTALSSGTTASSTALRRMASARPGFGSGFARDIVPWAKRISLSLTFAQTVATTNGIFRITLGKTVAAGYGALATKGIGIQVANAALSGIAHDGSSLDTVDLSTSLTSLQTVTVAIVSDGSGNIEWFVNGVSAGTSTGGPSSTGTAGEGEFQIETGNNADSVQQALEFNLGRYLVE